MGVSVFRKLLGLVGMGAAVASASAVAQPLPPYPVPTQQTVGSAPPALREHEILKPDWLKLPDARAMERYWNGQYGSARIRCVVTVKGMLDQCTVVLEDPPGRGLGAVALSMAPLFRMRPETVDGHPVGGAVITVPVDFRR